MRPSSLHPPTSPMTSSVTENSLSLHPVFLVVQAPTEKLTANYSYRQARGMDKVQDLSKIESKSMSLAVY